MRNLQVQYLAIVQKSVTWPNAVVGMRNFFRPKCQTLSTKVKLTKLEVVAISTFPSLAWPLRILLINMAAPTDYPCEPQKSLVEEALADREEQIWLLISEIRRVKDNRRFTSLRCRIAARRLIRILKLPPGLANPRLQKRLYRDAISYSCFSRKRMRFKTLTPEGYFEKKVAPTHILRILLNRNLIEPRYIRIGKNWIKDASGAKLKTKPNSLRKADFIKWLIAETYKGMSTILLTEICEEIESRDPLDYSITLQKIIIREGNPRYRNRSARFDLWFLWYQHDPELVLLRLEEKGLWSWRPTNGQSLGKESEKELLSKIELAATPQGQEYIHGLRKLVKQGIDPSELDDKELSLTLHIVPPRIRQLRSAFRKTYLRICE
jgi:hypothetical protein